MGAPALAWLQFHLRPLLQAIIRGRKAVKEKQKRKAAIITLQAVIRGFAARRRAARIRKARKTGATAIQVCLDCRVQTWLTESRPPPPAVELATVQTPKGISTI
jgi:hypothetical protein